MRGLYIVAEGWWRSARHPGVRTRTGVSHRGPGATLGEGPLFDRGGYIATAIATASTRVLFLSRRPRGSLPTPSGRDPVDPRGHGAALARICRDHQRSGGLSGSATARWLDAWFLSARPPRKSPTLTQAAPASRLGTVRELVARAFSELEDRGLNTRRCLVTIHDAGRLAASRGRGLERREGTIRFVGALGQARPPL